MKVSAELRGRNRSGAETHGYQGRQSAGLLLPAGEPLVKDRQDEFVWELSHDLGMRMSRV